MTACVKDIRETFGDMLNHRHFTIDRTGRRTLEIVGASFLADDKVVFGIVNNDYVRREIRWYENQSTNINDIEGETPKAWIATGNRHGEINSNYGHLIYSDKYANQFQCVVNELHNNPNSRRAQMIYNRPSIWYEAFENGKNDFICTNAVTYYVRNGRLHCVVQMRSNDLIYGYKNDYAWQLYVLHNVLFELNRKGNDYDLGDIHWQVMNLHVYEPHFYLVDYFNKTNDIAITKKMFREKYPESEYAQ